MARIVCFDRVPEEESFLLTPAITQDMDPRCLRSLNGYRATCELLQLVPNVERFRLTLRVVSLCSVVAGVSSKIFSNNLPKRDLLFPQ